MKPFGGMAPTLTDKLRNTNPPLCVVFSRDRDLLGGIHFGIQLFSSSAHRI